MSRSAPRRRAVWVIAHRGASTVFPDNTRAAFDEALRQGCDAIELDVQLSRDEVPVVYHDRTLARAGGGRRRVAQLDLRELRALDAAARFDGAVGRQTIPTLQEVLEHYGKKTRLLIEIKSREGRAGAPRHRGLARAVAEMVRRQRLERRAFVLSFDRGLLDESAQVAPRVPRVLNLKPGPALRKRLRELLPSLHALSVDVRTLTRGFAAAAREAGCPLWVFTCNTPGRVGVALRAGAAGIMSDKPQWLAARIDREGARG